MPTVGTVCQRERPSCQNGWAGTILPSPYSMAHGRAVYETADAFYAKNFSQKPATPRHLRIARRNRFQSH